MNTKLMNKENDYGNMKLAVKLHDIWKDVKYYVS
jgi:CRISPR/Cas system-associated endonuclease Cas3-HD